MHPSIIASTLCCVELTVGHVQGNVVEENYPDLVAEESKVAKPDKVLKYGTAGEAEQRRAARDLHVAHILHKY